MLKQNVLLTLFLLLFLNLFSQSQKTIDGEAITKMLYQHAGDDTPGIALGIVKDGKIVYEYYMGYAELTHKAKITKDTRFNIASNAKQFTALCILKLIEEGKIKLEDDIRKYLPDLYKKIEDKITIAHLITHTSGVRDYGDLMGLQGQTWWQEFIDNGDVMEMLRAQQDLNFKPGTEHMYCNSNYILQAAIVEKVTDQSFGAYAKAMFEELDMHNTAFLTSYGAVMPNKARPYGNWGAWFEEPTIVEVHGDGALFTTLPDQLKWEQIVHANDGSYLSKKVIRVTQGSGFY